MAGNVDKDNIQVLFVCFQEAFEKFSEVLGLLNNANQSRKYPVTHPRPKLLIYRARAAMELHRFDVAEQDATEAIGSVFKLRLTYFLLTSAGRNGHVSKS